MVPAATASRGVKHDFHAAVLLGFEGLVKIWAVSEIRAAVGDKEGGVDLLLLDELGQRFEITFHVRLAAAQPQALLHNRAMSTVTGPP
jgi:hypothetical protein